MPLIVAIEPDRKQAAHLAALAKGPLRAEWILAETTGRAFAALGDRVPDLILTSALLPPKDEDALAERLRALDAAASHVQTLTIPVFASARRARKDTTSVLSRLTRSRTPVTAAPEGCDPGVFAAQVAEYLERAADERRRAESERTAAASADEEPVMALLDFVLEPAADEIVSDEIVSVDEPTAHEPAEPPAFAEPAFVAPAFAAPALSASDYLAPTEILEPVQAVETPAVAAPELVEPVDAVQAAAPAEPAAAETIEAVPDAEPMGVLPAEQPQEVPEWPPAIALERQAPALISVGDLDLRAFLAELEAATADVEVRPAADPPLEPVQEPAEAAPAAAGTLEEDRTDVVAQDLSPASTAEEPVQAAPIAEEPPPATRVRDAIDLNASDLWMALPGPCHRWWPPIEGVAAEDAPLAAPFAAVPRAAAPEIVVQEQPAAPPTEPAPPAARRKRRKKAVALIQDEWGFFDPAQCGFAALVAKLDEIADPDEDPPPTRP